MVNLQFVSSVDSKMTDPISALEMQIFMITKNDHLILGSFGHQFLSNFLVLHSQAQLVTLFSET